MNKSDVLTYFSGTINTAKALGISHAAVSRWPAVIPLGRAYEIESITNGALKVDRSLYERNDTDAAA